MIFLNKIILFKFKINDENEKRNNNKYKKPKIFRKEHLNLNRNLQSFILAKDVFEI